MKERSRRRKVIPTASPKSKRWLEDCVLHSFCENFLFFALRKIQTIITKVWQKITTFTNRRLKGEWNSIFQLSSKFFFKIHSRWKANNNTAVMISHRECFLLILFDLKLLSFFSNESKLCPKSRTHLYFNKFIVSCIFLNFWCLWKHCGFRFFWKHISFLQFWKSQKKKIWFCFQRQDY